MNRLRPALLWVAVLAAGLGLWAGHRVAPAPTPATVAAGDGLPAASAAAGPVPVIAQVGAQIPSIVLPTLDDTRIDLAQFRGRPLLVNVWASWCAPCVEEMPELARFAQAQGADGVQVVGVALDTPGNVRAFLQRVPVEYPIVLDVPGPTDASVLLGNAQGLLPYTVLIDAEGRIAKRRLGPFAHGEIDAWATPVAR